MKTGLALKKEWRKYLLLEYGTCSNIAAKVNISVVTISKAINGECIGHATRTALFGLISAKKTYETKDNIFEIVEKGTEIADEKIS